MTRSIKTKNLMLKTTTLSIAIRNDAQQILKLNITIRNEAQHNGKEPNGTQNDKTKHYNKMWYSA